MSSERPAAQRNTLLRALQATAALGLLAVVIWIAGPPRILQLLSTSSPRVIAAAALVFVATIVVRGVRLVLLLPPRNLSLHQAALVAAAAQAAGQVVPARLGELALPWLLARTCQRDLASGTATLLAARTLDLAALGAWTVAACAAASAAHPAVWAAGGVLLLAPVLLPWTTRLVDAAAQRWLGSGDSAARWAGRLHRLHSAVVELQQSRSRLALAAAASLTMWGGVWVFTWLLLDAMGHRWPPIMVAAGSAVASVANIIPINVFANFGTLEAGWTAAFSSFGIPLATAAATGLAAHLWAFLFTVVFGAFAWLVLALTTKS